MTNMSHYFTEVGEAEYNAMFDFYVKQLGFDYMECDYATMKDYMAQQYEAQQLDIIIEGLKLGNQCIVFINNERKTEGYHGATDSYKQVL